jgi:uncharacterized membrane-anchored protein
MEAKENRRLSWQRYHRRKVKPPKKHRVKTHRLEKDENNKAKISEEKEDSVPAQHKDILTDTPVNFSDNVETQTYLHSVASSTPVYGFKETFTR